MLFWRGAFPLWQNDSGEIAHLELYERDGRMWATLKSLWVALGSPADAMARFSVAVLSPASHTASCLSYRSSTVRFATHPTHRGQGHRGPALGADPPRTGTDVAEPSCSGE